MTTIKTLLYLILFSIGIFIGMLNAMTTRISKIEKFIQTVEEFTIDYTGFE